MPIAFLLAMQAAGMVVDWYGRKNQIDMARMGEKINQAGIEANINMTRLETEDASLQSMKNLRMALGTQAAIQAARGNRSNAGSAVALSTNAINNFNADERTRRINQVGREATLRAGGVISKLHQDAYENDIWKEFRTNAFNNISSNPGNYFGGSNNAFSGTKATGRGSFGFTNVGGY